MTYASFDDTSADLIPATALHVAYYADGIYANLNAVRKQCPHALVMPILVIPDFLPKLKDLVGWEHGVEIDVENTDWTPSETPMFVHACILQGVPPRIYASLDSMPAVISALNSAGITRNKYKLRSANWTGEPHIDPGMDATQFTNHALGQPLDESLNNEGYFAITHAPTYSGTGEVFGYVDLDNGTWHGFHEPNTPKPSYRGHGKAAVRLDLDTGDWRGTKPPTN